MTDLPNEQLLAAAVQHHKAGQLAQAEALYREILSRNPDRAEVSYNNLGAILNQTGRFDEAVVVCRQALAIKPNYASALYNLANALRAVGHLNQALADWQDAVTVDPRFAEAHSNIGNALRVLDRLEESIAAFKRAIALKPALAEAHNGLAIVLRRTKQFDEALTCCQTAIALKPDYAEAFNTLGNLLRDTGDTAGAIAAFRQSIELDPGFSQSDSDLLYTLHLHPTFDARKIADEHARWNFQHTEPLRQQIRAHPNDRDPQRRIRIGYVSPDFHDHPVGRFITPLLENHDKAQFEIFAYAQVAKPDALTRRLQSHTDAWRDIFMASDANVCDMIRQDRIDLLIDLTMHSSNNRMQVFAQKPAPVQLTYLAYCSTTGLSTMDYRLSDPYLDPPGGDESVYSEKTTRLPQTYWCYQPAIEPPESTALPALQKGRLTFGCLNNFCKVTEQAIHAWSQILLALPQSELMLSVSLGSHRGRLQYLFEQKGVTADRVKLVPPMPMQDYFKFYDEIDIALDTFPYAGGTTTCDALWMGVPVVSLVGRTAVGRCGVSILSNLGLPELIANSEKAYTDIAIALANDLTRLVHLRKTLRERMERSPLMNAAQFAQDVEEIYRAIWRAWCTGAG